MELVEIRPALTCRIIVVNAVADLSYMLKARVFERVVFEEIVN